MIPASDRARRRAFFLPFKFVLFDFGLRVLPAKPFIPGHAAVAVAAEYSQIEWIVVGRISVNMVDHNMLSFMANAAGTHVGYEKRFCHSRWYRGARFHGC